MTKMTDYISNTSTMAASAPAYGYTDNTSAPACYQQQPDPYAADMYANYSCQYDCSGGSAACCYDNNYPGYGASNSGAAGSGLYYGQFAAACWWVG